jgi:hypothetical protein
VCLAVLRLSRRRRGRGQKLLASVRPRDIAGKPRRRVAADDRLSWSRSRRRSPSSPARSRPWSPSAGRTWWTSTVWAPSSPDASRPTSVTWPASPTGTGSRPGPAPHPWTPRPGSNPPPAVRRREPAGQPHAAHRRNDTAGRAHYRRKIASGKTPMEAKRCLKRRISDAVYRQLVADAQAADIATENEAPEQPRTMLARVREGTAGRLKNPARLARTRTPALRISHIPDPRPPRYNPPGTAGRPPPREPSPRRVDDRGEPKWVSDIRYARRNDGSIAKVVADCTPVGSLPRPTGPCPAAGTGSRVDLSPPRQRCHDPGAGTNPQVAHSPPPSDVGSILVTEAVRGQSPDSENWPLTC